MARRRIPTWAMGEHGRSFGHGVRYIGGGVFELVWFMRAGWWIRRGARETDRAGALRFVRRWRITVDRLLAIDLGIAPPLTRREWRERRRDAFRWARRRRIPT